MSFYQLPNKVNMEKYTNQTGSPNSAAIPLPAMFWASKFPLPAGTASCAQAVGVEHIAVESGRVSDAPI